MERRTEAEGSFDCVVVGGGHAGSCAALSAAQTGCRVLIVEKAPKEWMGGNGYFTAGAHRTVHAGLRDLLPIIHNAPPDISTIEMDPYTEDDFTRDLLRLSDNRCDNYLAKELVAGSRGAIEWLAREVGVRFTFSFNRQAYQVNGRQKFWGGMVLSVEDGGKGLTADHQRALMKAGIEIWYDSPAVELFMEDNVIAGLAVRRENEIIRINVPAVILASGGYESSAQLRAKYLGDRWMRARVRGTPYNTGDGVTMALTLGAKLAGDWSNSGCHSTCWDAHAPADNGDRFLSNQFTKSGYPFGLMLNTRGRRFVDEGEDFRNYTYAKFGRAILDQPDGIAFQVFDTQAEAWLRIEEYGDGIVKKIYANTLEELAQKLEPEGLAQPVNFIQTIKSYNAAVESRRVMNPGLKWNPTIKDGISTGSESPNVSPPKSNWALPLSSPPFLAIKVACGLTFTFGGLAIHPETAGVLKEADEKPIQGLFCTGELVGGLFYGNYPGGSGLTAGAVFGRKAGTSAAELVKITRETKKTEHVLSK